VNGREGQTSIKRSCPLTSSSFRVEAMRPNFFDMFSTSVQHMTQTRSRVVSFDVLGLDFIDLSGNVCTQTPIPLLHPHFLPHHPSLPGHFSLDAICNYNAAHRMCMFALFGCMLGCMAHFQYHRIHWLSHTCIGWPRGLRYHTREKSSSLVCNIGRI
jgi:hypothetical protein